MAFSVSFATIVHEAHINTKSDYFDYHMFKTMTAVELNTLHTMWSRRNSIFPFTLNVLQKSTTCFLKSRNRNDLPYVEGSNAWLYDWPHRFSPLYIAEQCDDENLLNMKTL